MLTLYTAVGTLKFQKTTGGKSIPLVINDGQEYGLSDDELLLWSCLACKTRRLIFSFSIFSTKLSFYYRTKISVFSTRLLFRHHLDVC